MKTPTNSEALPLTICSANVDASMIRIPEGFGIGIIAWHERSKRAVTLIERQLGDGWICAPLNGDRAFYEHSKFILPNAQAMASTDEKTPPKETTL
jgi:hypothetical protein